MASVERRAVLAHLGLLRGDASSQSRVELLASLSEDIIHPNTVSLIQATQRDGHNSDRTFIEALGGLDNGDAGASFNAGSAIQRSAREEDETEQGTVGGFIAQLLDED